MYHTASAAVEVVLDGERVVIHVPLGKTVSLPHVVKLGIVLELYLILDVIEIEAFNGF